MRSRRNLSRIRAGGVDGLAGGVDGLAFGALAAARGSVALGGRGVGVAIAVGEAHQLPLKFIGWPRAIGFARERGRDRGAQRLQDAERAAGFFGLVIIADSEQLMQRVTV